MLGIAIGALSVIGLIKLSRDRWHHRMHHAHDCGPHGGRDFGWRRGRSMLSGLFWRLGTTPEQEKTIFAAIHDLKDTGQSANDNARRAGLNLALALKNGSFQATVDGDVNTRIDSAYHDMKEATRTALQKIYDVLDEKQRTTLAELVEQRVGRHFSI